LQTFHSDLQFQQLGPESHLVQSLLQPIQAFLHSLQPGHQHVVFRPHVVDLVAQGVEERVHLVPQPLLRASDDSLDIRDDDLAMEPREYRDQIFPVPDPTASYTATPSTAFARRPIA
jgi:hypothetical protein